MASNDYQSQLRLTSQHPLDAKTLFATYTEMNSDLSTKAFTYSEGMVAYCFDTKKLYQWIEIIDPVGSYFEYPSSWIIDGMDYSGKKYNFEELIVGNSNLILADGLYAGYITYESLLVYINTILTVVIGGNQYFISAGTIELSVADATYPRIDVITARIVEVSGQIIASLSFYTGIPSANPIKPTIITNGIEIELTTVFIPKAGDPELIYSTVIYDELLGAPNEYDIIESPLSSGITLDSLEFPKEGNNCIKVNYPLLTSGDKIIMTAPSGTDIDMLNLSNLRFSVYIGTEISGIINSKKAIPERYILIKLFNNSIQYGSEVRVSNNTYGFSSALEGVHQPIVIPANEFIGIQGNINNTVNRIEIEFIGELGTEIFLDTFYWTFGQPLIPSPGTYKSLLDTTDTNFDGKEDWSPAVVGDKLTLKRMVQFTDLYRGNAIIYGGWSHVLGEDLVFYIWTSLFIKDNVVYQEFIQGNVTLDAAPGAPNSRFDLLIIDTVTPQITLNPVHYVNFLKGSEGLNPVHPTVNQQLQVEVSFKLLTSDETLPPEVITELVYDENLEEATEWTNNLFSAAVNLAYATNPWRNNVSIFLPKSTVSVPAQVGWFNDTPIVYSLLTFLHFGLLLSSTWKKNSRIIITLKYGSNIMANIILTPQSIKNYGYDTNNWNTWQHVSIPLTSFLAWSKTWVFYDDISFSFEDLPNMQLDQTFFQGGLEQPPNNDYTTFLNLTDTPNSYIGQALKKLRINSSENGIEFYEESLSFPYTMFVDSINGNDTSGEYENYFKPFKTVAAALAGLPVSDGTSINDDWYNNREFTIHIVDDDSHTINQITKHNLIFKSEFGANLMFEHTGIDFEIENFGNDINWIKCLEFDMPKSVITFKRTDAGNVLTLKSGYSLIKINAFKVLCETFEPLNYGIYRAGVIYGNILTLECTGSGFEITGLSNKSSGPPKYDVSPELFIYSLIMTNNVDTAIANSYYFSDCAGITADSIYHTFKLHIGIASGLGPTKSSIFRGDSDIFIYIKDAFNIRLFEWAQQFILEFQNSWLQNVKIGISYTSPSFGGPGTWFKGTIGMFVITSSELNDWTGFNKYDHIVANNTTGGLSLGILGATFWNVTVLSMRVQATNNDDLSLDKIAFFNAPNGLCSSHARTVNESAPYGNIVTGFVFVDAKFYNIPIRILGACNSSVTKDSNYNQFVQYESLFFYGDNYFDGTGEFLTIDDPTKEKRLLVKGTLRLGTKMLFNTAGNLEVLYDSNEILQELLAFTGGLSGSFTNVTDLTGNLTAV